MRERAERSATSSSPPQPIIPSTCPLGISANLDDARTTLDPCSDATSTLPSLAVPFTTPRASAQTPQQRLANERFAKSEANKRGKPVTVVKKQEVHKSPISKTWIILLAFVLCGGVIFELLRLFF
ncbi:uncharacterized protein K452DRAFT_318400 [Aplosporella prunicola CBS 121167]|uniref:Stress-associated endoplasmic reticulum protein n=1 Tax=Aplosporella prunicola CBS 121167 TaxID=1176127 RepID=A0A6A6BFL1_9PEZI|nr:uncharacterized protein K452DRAFT_318400 [Aplosporella prunicola CBS 121167]KAF2142095.1 hypothetical protein K452DRAFT_318400 [Aplosporella prunicola CBS 121167]